MPNYDEYGIKIDVTKPKFKKELWTRVLEVGVATPSSTSLCPLQEELDLLEADPLPPRKAQKKPWELLFDPDLLDEELGPLHIEDYRLTEDEMLRWATLCTTLRASFRN